MAQKTIKTKKIVKKITNTKINTKTKIKIKPNKKSNKNTKTLNTYNVDKLDKIAIDALLSL